MNDIFYENMGSRSFSLKPFFENRKDVVAFVDDLLNFFQSNSAWTITIRPERSEEPCAFSVTATSSVDTPIPNFSREHLPIYDEEQGGSFQR